ncbi:MAG: pyruvate kinase [Planctomycetota bacterium]|jgi:pyruvate kinase
MDFPRTKIVATLGPATDGPKTLEAMLREGLSVVRINMSHGTHEEHSRRLAALHLAGQATGRTFAVLVDLCGPKIRTGALEKGEPRLLTPGAEVTLVSAGFTPAPGEIPASYPHLHTDVRAGEPVLLSDGKIRLRALDAGDGRLRTRVEEGGLLNARQGINLPGTDLSIPALSEKDRKDLAFGVQQGADYVALSFVRAPKDVEACKAALAEESSRAQVIAKIEKPEALTQLEAILDVSDGVMVARGDLAIEVSTPKVPLFQKEIIAKANQGNRLVITATQMLESMVEKTLPTRAEATDVANAVLDGTDALMLSGETAVGRHPALVVRTMASIAHTVEQSPFFREKATRSISDEDDSRDLSIAHAAFVAYREYRAEALIVFTESGKTARILSKFKPDVPLFALTPHAETLRRLALVWGVTPVRIPETANVGEMITSGQQALLSSGILRGGEKVIITAGATRVAGGTDMLKVCRIGKDRLD